MARGQDGDDELLGDQPPAHVDDLGEDEAPFGLLQLNRQAGHLGEVPDIVVEHRPGGPVREAEAGQGGYVGACEHRAR